MPIQPVRVQDCWDEISPEIDLIMKDLPWKEFRKEDIYADCAGGNAAIFVDTDFPLGESFFIARIDQNNTGRVTDFVADMASNAGCSAVEFVTGSKEVMEHGIAYDFEKVMYRCRKEVIPRSERPVA